MAAGNVVQMGNAPQGMSAAEWHTRVELAAAFRLIDHYGIRDLTHNHLSARIPDEPDCILVKPSDWMFNEVTASSLLKYRMDGTPMPSGKLPATDRPMSDAVKVVHGGMLALRPEFNAVFHIHSPAAVAVAAQKCGLLPLSQHAMMFYNRVAYHDFHGFEFDPGMEKQLAEDLGPHKVAILRNHGLLVCSDTVGEAFVQLHFLEYACRIQVAALTSEVVLPSPEIAESAARTMERIGATAKGGKNWPAALRLCERLYTDYRS